MSSVRLLLFRATAKYIYIYVYGFFFFCLDGILIFVLVFFLFDIEWHRIGNKYNHKNIKINQYQMNAMWTSLLTSQFRDCMNTLSSTNCRQSWLLARISFFFFFLFYFSTFDYEQDKNVIIFPMNNIEKFQWLPHDYFIVSTKFGVCFFFLSRMIYANELLFWHWKQFLNETQSTTN